MQRQHLPLRTGIRFREPGEKFWHDLPSIIDQGSKKVSRVQFLLANGTAVGRRSGGALQRRRVAAARRSRATFTHAATEQETEQELLHCWRSMALPFSERRTGVVSQEGDAPSREEWGEPKKRNALNANQMDGVNGGGMDWVSGEAARSPLFIHGLQGRGGGLASAPPPASSRCSY